MVFVNLALSQYDSISKNNLREHSNTNVQFAKFMFLCDHELTFFSFELSDDEDEVSEAKNEPKGIILS